MIEHRVEHAARNLRVELAGLRGDDVADGGEERHAQRRDEERQRLGQPEHHDGEHHGEAPLLLSVLLRKERQEEGKEAGREAAEEERDAPTIGRLLMRPRLDAQLQHHVRRTETLERRNHRLEP